MADMTSPFPAEEIRILDFDFDRATVAGAFHLVRLVPKEETGYRG